LQIVVDNSYKWGGRLLIDGRGSAALRLRSLASRNPKRAIPEIHVRFAKNASGEETGYGIGWGIAKSASDKPIYEHSGGSVGGHSQLVIYPGTRVVWPWLRTCPTPTGDARKWKHSRSNLKVQRNRKTAGLLLPFEGSL
jgi:CubicO group peptidase (beta-lactamase class C family)